MAIAVEFEQLLLTRIEGCGLRSNTNRFKVGSAAAGLHTQLTCTAREMILFRFSKYEP